VTANIKEAVFFFCHPDEQVNDITGEAQLLAFSKSVYNGVINEQFLLYQPLPETKKAKTFLMLLIVISVLMIGMEIMHQHRHGWCSLHVGKPERIHHTGQTKEFQNCFTHCFLHRVTLISKSVVPEVQKVLDKMTKMVNYIKNGPLHSRLFSALCSAMEATHNSYCIWK
jgi:hypothetical protein